MSWAPLYREQPRDRVRSERVACRCDRSRPYMYPNLQPSLIPVMNPQFESDSFTIEIPGAHQTCGPGVTVDSDPVLNRPAGFTLY